MKLGLISDIHEHVEHLRAALAAFERRGVEQVVVLGDVCEMGQRLDETCRLLADAGAIGVWGNHDFGLCYEPTREVIAAHSPSVVDYLASLRPRLELAGCLFTHVEPWLDPTSVTDLWYYEGPPDQPHKLDRIFAAAPHRLLFAGHFHAWLLATPRGIRNWRGQSSITLEGDRFFVVVGALCDGQFATFDTQLCELTPLASRER